MAAVILSLGERINFHPHIQCMAKEGGKARMVPFSFKSGNFDRAIFIHGYQQMEIRENWEG